MKDDLIKELFYTLHGSGEIRNVLMQNETVCIFTKAMSL
jgi:hypothetical protein